MDRSSRSSREAAAAPRCEPAPPPQSLRRRLVKGAIWATAGLWATRGLGVISTLLLARLLQPQDFGLVAMATVIAGFLNVLFTYGIDTALIQNSNPTRADWDTAWSMQIVQGAVFAALVALLAPLGARFYGEPRVMPVMLVLAGGILLASGENIGVVSFQKDLQYHRRFQLSVIRKTFQISVGVALAFILRNYWALVAATVAGQGFGTIVSYVMHPLRPRWSLSRARQILAFTWRMAFINLAQYFTFEGERIVVGALTGARLTGFYSIANEIGNLPTTELTGAMIQPAFPGLVEVKHDPERLRAGYLDVLGLVALYALPAGVGVTLVAPALVPLALGAQWQSAVPLLQILAVAGALRAVCGPPYTLLVVIGRLNDALAVAWLQAGSQIAFLVPAIARFGLAGAAVLNGIVAALTLAVYIAQVGQRAGVRARDHLGVLWRPPVATAVMVAACRAVSPLFAEPLAWLVCVTLAGAVSYAAAALVLWFACGRPRGPEQHLLELLGTRLARRG